MKNNKLKNGFTLLLSVLVTSIILSVGLGIFNIMTKELKLSGVGRESQVAFYAADAGIECFFFWEIKHPNLADTAFNAPNTINCAGNSIANNFSGNVSNFSVPLSNNSCAKINVAKNTSLSNKVITTVESRGYNTACDSNSPFKVERAIQLVSTKQEGEGVYAPPNPPTNITVNSNSFHKVNVSWNNSSGAVSYNVYRGIDSKNLEIAASGVAGQNYTDGGLDKNTDYYYYVTAVGAYGESNPSETDNAKTKDTQEEIFTSNINWSVPSGVQEVRISAYGAQGGGNDGGKGGYASAIFNINPSDSFYINVGGAGAVSGSCGSNIRSAGGFNGGGDSKSGINGGCPGTGGGGASDVRKGTDSLNNRIIVAGGGGGGGGGSENGPGGKGGAGCTSGCNGSNGKVDGNGGGSGGGGGNRNISGGVGGNGVNSGESSFNNNGGDGGIISGSNSDARGSGGGGGGGYFGGGGGGAGNQTTKGNAGGGGGGGSSYTSGLYPKYQDGLNSGNGKVVIEY